MSYLIGQFAGKIGKVETLASGNDQSQYIRMSVAHDQMVKDPSTGQKVKNTLWIRVTVNGARVPGLSAILTKGMFVTGVGPQTIEVWFNEKQQLWVPQVSIRALDLDFSGGNQNQQQQRQGQQGQQPQQRPQQGQQQNRPPQQGQQRPPQQQPQQGYGPPPQQGQQRPPQQQMQQPQNYGPPPQQQPQGYGPPPQQRQAPAPQQAPQQPQQPQYGPPPQQGYVPPQGQTPGGYGPSPGFDGGVADDDIPF